MLRSLLILIAPATVLLIWLALSPRTERADFVVASDQLRTIDPQRVSFQDELQVVAAMFEGLTRLSETTLAPEPGVAASWSASGDGLEWTFQLRADARWSNGAPVTAHDFEWSWRRVLNPATAAQYVSALFVIRGARSHYESQRAAREDMSPSPAAQPLGVEVLGPQTLRVTLVDPCPYLLELLALPVFAPLYRPLVERFDGPSRDVGGSARQWTRPENIVCNGAFAPVRWTFKDRLLLRKNAHYWEAEQIAAESIELLLSGDVSSALVGYQTGAVDLVRGLDVDLARELLRDQQAGQNVGLHVGPRYATFFFRVNCLRPPLDDARVRRALSLAIDREAICAFVLGLGELPAAGYVPPLEHGAASSHADYARLGLPVDRQVRLSLARSLLAEVTRESGPLRPLEIAIAPEPTQFRRVAEAIQAMWERDLGVQVELRQQESKVLSERIRRLDYDLARSNWFGDYLDPMTFLEMFTSNSGQNRTGWADPQYDELVAAAQRESDPAQRATLLHAAETRLVAGGAPILPVYHMAGNYLLRPGFHGLADNPRGTLLIHRVRPPRPAQRAAAPRG